MKKHIFSLFLISCLLLTFSVSPSAYEITSFEVPAKSAALFSLDTNDFLYSKNIDQKVYPASITKIMTAVLEAETEDLDALVEQLNSTTDRKKTIREIICLIRSVVSLEKADVPIVESIKDLLQENLAEDLSLRDIASRMCISVYYMCHLFKKATGITIGEYKKELKLTKAKEFLVKTDMKITEISEKCGFGSDSYFSKVFMESEKLSPTQYRENVRKHQG